jgi:hypothetical protein
MLTAEVQEVVVLEALDGLELTANVEGLGGAEQVLDAGVGIIVATKDLDGLVGPRLHV